MERAPRFHRVVLVLIAAALAATAVLALQLTSATRAGAHADPIHETHRHWQDSHGHWHRWIYYGHTDAGCITGGSRTVYYIEQHGDWRYGDSCHVHS